MLINVCFIILLSFDAAKLLLFSFPDKHSVILFAHTAIFLTYIKVSAGGDEELGVLGEFWDVEGGIR